jgi:eukaryotic-like serine/threonine-protein kinase
VARGGPSAMGGTSPVAPPIGGVAVRVVDPAPPVATTGAVAGATVAPGVVGPTTVPVSPIAPLPPAVPGIEPETEVAAGGGARGGRRRRSTSDDEPPAGSGSGSSETPPPEPTPPAEGTPSDVGYLTLATSPWTNVSCDGRSLGETPLMHVTLPVGHHSCRLVNEAEGIHESYDLDIRPGETTRVRLGLR